MILTELTTGLRRIELAALQILPGVAPDSCRGWRPIAGTRVAGRHSPLEAMVLPGWGDRFS